MATSGYFDGAKSTYGWYLRLEYNVVSSTSVNLTLKIYDGTGESHNTTVNSCYYVIQGTKTYQTYSYSSKGWYTLGSKTVTVSSSTTNLDISASWYSGFTSQWTPASLSVSGTITVNSAPKTMSVTSLSDWSGYENTSKTFSVTASGGTSYTYQWYFNGVAISNATSRTYTRTIKYSDGEGQIYCKVTDTSGAVAITNRATLYVGLASSKNKIEVEPVSLVEIKKSSGFTKYIPWVYKNGIWTIYRWNVLEGITTEAIADLAIADIAIAT